MTHPSCARSGGPDPAEGADAKSGLVPTWGVQRRPHCRPKCRMGPCPRRNGILSPLPGGRGPSSVSSTTPAEMLPAVGGWGAGRGTAFHQWLGPVLGPEQSVPTFLGASPTLICSLVFFPTQCADSGLSASCNSPQGETFPAPGPSPRVDPWLPPCSGVAQCRPGAAREPQGPETTRVCV